MCSERESNICFWLVSKSLVMVMVIEPFDMRKASLSKKDDEVSSRLKSWPKKI
ncbi:hypothetical protein BRARA_D00285 [Brassica rapa]|uniref:Uncharacterized protein n=1 Tax=Brassica campestris TaxID=3711 RepID=A0A397ZL38_BRACM|nr:hypothetical protein BRARA_D00285 [Brassica rapa]